MMDRIPGPNPGNKRTNNQSPPRRAHGTFQDDLKKHPGAGPEVYQNYPEAFRSFPEDLQKPREPQTTPTWARFTLTWTLNMGGVPEPTWGVPAPFWLLGKNPRGYQTT